MEVNVSKSAFQIFLLFHQSITQNIRLNDTPLEQVTEFKYLGVTLYSKFPWKNHVAHEVEKTQKRPSKLY